jgi:AcrR family transcriptional regulator
LLRVALDEFLEKGFDTASFDGIAAATGMSKRTIYARYPDKAALFKAAIGRVVDSYTIPAARLAAAEADSLRETLLNVARLRIANLSSPDAIKLQRVLTAQSYRFPELFRAAFEQSAAPTIAFLAAQFDKHAARGEIAASEPRRLVTAFLSLVVGGPSRLIVAGEQLEVAEIERHLAFTVDLFLDGIRSR